MKKNFDRAVSFVLTQEGGYTNDPSDKGGETKYGITKKSYPNVDIKNLTEQDAKDIYYRDYWVPAGCDTLNYPTDIIMFDTAVNCGLSRAKKWLQASNQLSIGLIFKRLEHYNLIVAANETNRKFLLGWYNRVINLYKSLTGGALA